MKTNLFQLKSLHRNWFSSSYGWTGIEIGCHAVQFAQVRKIAGQWQLNQTWTVEHPVPYSVSNENYSTPEHEVFGWLTIDEIAKHCLAPTRAQFENLNQLFFGRNCAPTLSDGMIAYRELELPGGNPSESRSMIQSEIALESESDWDELCTDSWELPPSRPNANTSCMGAVSLGKSVAIGIANDLSQSGFECQILDAPQCAMARATAMVVDNEQLSTLAINLGYRQATLTLVKDGKPLLSRGLLPLGLIHLLENVATSWNVSMAEAQTLLFVSGSDRQSDSRTGNFANPIEQATRAFVNSLSGEINKTINFINRSDRRMAPEQLLLMGDGVRISGLEHLVSERSVLTTTTWSIAHPNSQLSRHHIATYAIASGLSALAWEET